MDSSSTTNLVLALATTLMAIATAIFAYHSWKLRIEQTRPYFAMSQHRYHDNPPEIGEDYEMVAFPGGNALLNEALGCGEDQKIVYYLYLSNVGNGIARNAEIRFLRNRGDLDIESNTVEICSCYPGDTYLIPLASTSTEDNIPDHIAKVIVRYDELFRTKFVGYAFPDECWKELAGLKRAYLHIRHPFRRFERLDAKMYAYLKGLCRAERPGIVRPIKNQFMPHFTDVGKERNRTYDCRNPST